MTDLFEIVQKYQQLGYVCIPVNVKVRADGSKHPQFPGKGYKQRRFDDRSDWEGYTGIAINTGMSGVVAIDLDRKVDAGGVVLKDGEHAAQAAGIQIPDSPMTGTSQSGGKHRLFKAGKVPVATLVDEPVDGIDIRAEGGVLFVYPTVVGGDPDRSYTWDGKVIGVDDLPEIPAEFAQLVASKSVEVIEPPEDYTPADCTPAQRDWALKKIEFKLADLADISPGQRWDGSKAVMRIIGLAKTVGADLNEVAEKVRYAYPGEEDQIEYSIRSALKNAKLEDPRSWPTTDFSPVGFWESRPELKHIYDAALARTTSPWAVLGAVAVRVLAMIPPTWQSFGEARGYGNFNLFSVLVGTSGAGKGGANAVAAALVPFDGRDIVLGNPVSGEAIPNLFGAGVESVIIDMPEYATLATNADRPGSTLVPTLCKAFSGEPLGVARADSTRSVNVAANGYRAGVIAGIQYDNAGMMLSPSAVATGLPQRFVWLPLNISESEAPERIPVWPGKLPLNLPVGAGWDDTVQEIPIPKSVDDQLRKIGLDVLFGRVSLSAQDAHRLYAQQKVAFFLAVINGHFDSIRESDWMLAEQVMLMSDFTRKRAVETMRKRDSALQKVRGEQAAERKVAADNYEYSLKVTRAANSIYRWLLKRPDLTGPTGSAINCLDSPLREPFGNAAIEQLVGEGRGFFSPDGKYITAVQHG